MTGLGTDIIEIARIERALRRPAFARRVFTPAERDWLAARGNSMPQSAAGLFCAKEAVAKALGTGLRDGLNLNDIEIGHTALGAPVVVRPRRNFLLSIAHCQSYATATAILLEGGDAE
ncbi:MAG TPA: holo-ACP synthase [Candidatus Butyricicoccus stercorigallinarum]|nr:holo-ACP synthase [Candidatus Butyricicoccus stercorigallinarum]